MTGSGKVMFVGLGHVHKRFNKGRTQGARLAKNKQLHAAYAAVVKRLGFRQRAY